MVHNFNRPIGDKLTISVGIKTEYTSRALVQLVNIYISVLHMINWIDKNALCDWSKG